MLVSPAFVLSIALSSGLWPRLVLGTDPQQDNAHPPIEGVVWRADNMEPSEVEARGGFWPRGQNGGQSPLRIQDTPLVDPDISLFRHVLGNFEQAASWDQSGYVATTIEFRRAMDWLWRYHRVPGYLYQIHVSPNFIDVAEVLRHHYRFRAEREVAALGGIHFSQIMGWRHVLEDPQNPGRILLGPYTPNPRYNAIFNTMRLPTPQYQLAGFPDGHEAHNQHPWNSVGINCGNHGGGRSLREAEGFCTAQKQSKDVAAEYMFAVEYVSLITKIDRLTVEVQLSGDAYSGTADSVSIKIGDAKPMSLFHGPWPGSKVEVTASVQDLFGSEKKPLHDLSRVVVIQIPADHPLMTDDFKIHSMIDSPSALRIASSASHLIINRRHSDQGPLKQL